MMRSKNSAGFLLLEALLAVAIVSLMLIPALVLLTGTFARVNEHMWEFRRLFFAQQFMAEMQRKNPDATKLTETKQEKNPKTELTYKIEQVNPKSMLAENDGMFKESVRAKGTRQQAVVELIQFVFKPETEKS